MPSFTDTDELSKLAASLKASLPQASLLEVPVHEDHRSLLIVQADHLVVAFALGEDESAYDVLYPAFKKYFVSRSSTWNTKDVSFVYCLPQSYAPSEKFCSRVEVDVYFCRKFVVRLDEDIDTSLVRLPFLPLSPVTGESLRPPSAQTFLRSLGVKADLARQLVVPGRSATSVLTDCLAGKFEEPNLESQAKPAGTATNAHVPSTSQSTLKSISIQNFRAYRSEREFELGTAVTVLYGPNGFGKTSFFDALDFAATGGIGRLSRAGTPLARAARHLDCADGDKTSVTLTFVKDGKTHKLTRDLNDLNKATLDGRPNVDRKELLNFLTGGSTPPADRVDNLVALFRATHLFSQENQALTEDFAGSSEVSGELVSRMLAFEDYVSGVKKATEVRDAVRQIMSRAVTEAQALRKSAAADSFELARLSKLASSGADTTVIESSLADLNNGLRKHGFDGAVAAKVEELRSLRLQLEERIATVDAQRIRLTSCISAVVSRRPSLDEAAKAGYEAAEATAAARNAERERSTAASNAREASENAASAHSDAIATQGRLDAISWAMAVKPQFDQLTEQRQALQGQYQETSAALVAAEAAVTSSAAIEAAALSAHQSAGAHAATSTSNVESLALVTRQAEELRQVYPALARTRVQIDACNEAIPHHQHRIRELREAAANCDVRASEIERLVEQVQNQESALKALVSQLRAHVTDGTCLFCAHDHGSKEALLRAVDANAPQSSALPEIQAQLSQTREEKRSKELQSDEEAAKLLAKQSELTGAMDERARLDAVVASFAQVVARLGVQFSGERDSLDAVDLQLREHQAVQLEQQRQHISEAGECAQRLQDARAAHASEVAKKNEAHAAVVRLDAAIDALRDTLLRLSSDVRASQASPTSSMEELKLLLASEQHQLQGHRAAHEAARANMENASKLQKEAEARMNAALASAKRSTERKLSNEERVNALGRTLSDAGFRVDASESDVQSALVQNSAQVSSLSDLRDRAHALEIALDAAATAAATQSIKTRIVDFEARATAADETVAKHRPWAEYFARVAEQLSEQQRKATHSFTEQYGPRTAVIQRRLRPVYGFGDLEVSSRGQNIAVHVKRNGEAHRPSDFFSQSQVQTLMLGLFLTACSSQTWSGFSSIMMDDPVTHFDDLNTYALLDLLSGLLRSPDGARQFVISTCDEKLLQLARQKFRHLGSAAKFYRFSAIGSDGPMVAEIPN